MKSTFLLFFLSFFSVAIFAQNGISFQGIARDPQGNAITDDDISVKFTIGTFVEVQNISTDNFGVFSATIGSVKTADFGDLVFANMTDNLKVEVDGTLIYDDKFNTVPYAKAADNGVPPGSIMPFAGPKNNIPKGWLYCDGDSYATTGMYRKLYEAIGFSWGNDGGKFFVPDLRGYFLRGIDDGSNNDPDVNDRWSLATGVIIGDKVGSYQMYELAAHAHQGSTDVKGAHSHDWKYPFSSDEGGNGSVSILGDDQNVGSGWNIPTDTKGDHSHTLNIVNTGGNETRPKNAGIVYIIKY